MGSSYVYDTKLNDSPGLELTGKIMVSIMVILFFTILLFIFLHFYFNTFASGRQQTTTTTTHRRRRRHHFVAADHSASATCCRLDPSVLNSIPIVTFGSKDKEMECAVCLSEIVERENIRILPKCNHGFHVDCIDMWFQSNSTCPICRNLLSNEPETKKGNEENLNVFPTNILVFGNQGGEPSSSSSSSSSSLSSNNRSNEMLVIDIPRQIEDEEIKSPIMRQLKSFKKLLSRSASRLSPSSSTDPGKMGSEQC